MPARFITQPDYDWKHLVMFFWKDCFGDCCLKQVYCSELFGRMNVGFCDICLWRFKCIYQCLMNLDNLVAIPMFLRNLYLICLQSLNYNLQLISSQDSPCYFNALILVQIENLKVAQLCWDQMTMNWCVPNYLFVLLVAWCFDF